MRRWRPALLLAALGALAGCTDAAQLEHGRRAAPITNGALDTGDAHVVALLDRRVICGQPAIPSCTGTVIAPRVVLTAAHCVEGSGADGTEVFLGSDVAEGGDAIYVEEVSIHPDWNETTRENDIALVLLRVPVEVAPTPLLAAMDGSFIGTEARLVGFGSPEAGAAPGAKRSGVAQISNVDPGTFWIVPSPGMSCQGDSGGPVFVTVGDTEYLAGVTSSGDVDCAELGINTRVDVHVDDFIAPYLAAVDPSPDAPDAGPPRSPIDVCAQPCAGDQECPEDTTCTLHDGEFRCSVAGLPYGFFSGDLCAGECDCGDGLCVALDRGGRPECTCYATCEPASGSDAAGRCDGDGGCGCAAAPGPGRGSLALLLLCAAALRRRARR